METLDFDDEWGTFAMFCVDLFERSIDKLTIEQRRHLVRDFDGKTFVRDADSDAIAIAAVQFVFNNENLMNVVKSELSERCKYVAKKKKSAIREPRPVLSPIRTELEPYVKIESSFQKGRHIMLTDNFEPYEKILARKPFESWLKTSLLTTHCYCCFHKLHSDSSDSEPIRCQSCQVVNYCSPDCDNEMSPKHEIECPAMKVLKDMSAGHLALRLALHGSDVTHGFEYAKKPNRGSSTDYDEILACVDHIEKYEPKVLLADSLGAVFLALLAVRTQIITSDVQEPFAGRILKHIYQIAVNGMQVIHKNYETKTQTPLGVGIYVHVTLLNHACYSQLNAQFNGNQIILSSRDRELKSGQELSFNYGPHFKVIKNREMRRAILRGFYFFECNCYICQNNIVDRDV